MKSCRSDAPSGPAALPRCGYTLLEILIALSLLVVLGAGLAGLLRQAVSIWSTAEKRGRVYEAGRALLERVAEDLRASVIGGGTADEGEWVRFIADEGAGGRQRLRFVRATSAETADSILREGGRALTIRAPAAYDGKDDAADARSGALLAPSGLMEVFYTLDPRPGKRLVWRGVRSPIGGPDSLLIDRNVEEGLDAPPPRQAAAPKAAPKPAGKDDGAKGTEPPPPIDPFLEDESYGLRKVAAPIADGVLFLGFRFWTPSTNTWEDVPALLDPKASQKSGPSPWWDSTRALLDLKGGRDEFTWHRVPDSLEDASDDIFPERVEVAVVIAEDEDAILGARLAEDVAEKAGDFTLTDRIEIPEAAEDRYVLIDDEWIEVEAVDGLKVSVARDGRGARWTKAAKHERGARVETGVTFRRVVEVPGYRRSISDAEAAPVRRGGRRR
jgi:prepilin-type N-terminal cleavage/methylation domain-containing protein